ncbi:MAG: pitrilysin family protein [Chitinophagales bacterium]
MRKKTLKSIITIASMLVISTASFSQTIKELNVDGFKVYFKPTSKQVISTRLFVPGGTSNYTGSQQGIEALALSVAMNGGTVSKNKTQFKTEAEKIGTSFGSSSSLDYSQMEMNCIKPFWEKSWDLFADAVMHPAFEANEFVLIKDQMVSDARQRESDPDAFLNDTAMSFVFKGRGYERNPNGSASSLERFTPDVTKQYYKNTITSGKCFLIVVGDLTEDEVISKVKATLAKLPAGTPAKMNANVTITQGTQNIVERDIATNYIIGLMTSPSMTSKDGIPMLVAMNIINSHMFVEVRTRRGLSYSPRSYVNTDAITSPYSAVYATSDSPKKVIEVITEMLNEFKKNGFSQDELANKKQEFLTTYLMGLETSASQSLAIGRWAVRGNVKGFEEFTTKVNAVTLKDLNRVVDQNTNAIVWTYLGHKNEIQPVDFKQTTVYQNKPY